jgi:hypothetical protein
MRILKQIRGHMMRFGGESHRGWLPEGAARLVQGKAQSPAGSCKSGCRLIKDEHSFIPHQAKDIRGASHMAPGNGSTSDDAAHRGAVSFPVATIQSWPRFCGACDEGAGHRSTPIPGFRFGRT